MFLDKWNLGLLFAEDDDKGGGGDADDKDGKDAKGESDDESGDESDDESGEGDDDDDEEKPEELTVEQQKEAVNLYKLITNRDTQQDALKILAKQAGLQIGDGKPPETKAEVKSAVKSTIEILEKALGKDMAWLAPKLAAAFDEIREIDRESNKKELDSLKSGNVAREVDQAYEKLSRDTKGESRKFESKMMGLADKLYPAPGMSVMEYVEMLYTIASAKNTNKSNSLRLAEKINRNSKDVPGRLTESGAAGGGKGADKNARLSLKDSVRAAAEKLGYKGS